MFRRFADLALAAPRRILVVAGLFLIVGIVVGAPVADHLKAGGFTVPDADSTIATEQLDEHFDGGAANLIFLVRDTDSADGADSDAAEAAGAEIMKRSRPSPTGSAT